MARWMTPVRWEDAEWLRSRRAAVSSTYDADIKRTAKITLFTPIFINGIIDFIII